MTPPTHGVRPARATDLEAVLAQEEQGFDVRERWSAQLWADELAADNRIVLVAGEPVAGVITVQHVGAVAELNRIVVGAAIRRTGLGRRLLAAAIAAAGEVRAEDMLLEVRADNEAARALYAASGFVDIARRNNYYGGGVDAVVMRLDLEGDDE